MTLIEAVKTGKPFRRHTEDDDLWFYPQDIEAQGIFLDKLEILAEDWEVEDDDPSGN